MSNRQITANDFEECKEYLFDWGEDFEEHARALGEALAEPGRTASDILGVIGATALMLEAHWEGENKRPHHEARRRADRFTRVALVACYDAMVAIEDRARH